MIDLVVKSIISEGIKDVEKKASEKATPVIKEKAVDDRRMTKAMGKTVIEEKPVILRLILKH